jgi:hypothetical protein
MRLLPLATEPFDLRRDRDISPSERREFVRTHRTCIFHTSPRHLHRNDQAEKITHWLSASVPWDADDGGTG